MRLCDLWAYGVKQRRGKAAALLPDAMITVTFNRGRERVLHAYRSETTQWTQWVKSFR
jgi:hypothetical protein